MEGRGARFEVRLLHWSSHSSENWEVKSWGREGEGEFAEESIWGEAQLTQLSSPLFWQPIINPDKPISCTAWANICLSRSPHKSNLSTNLPATSLLQKLSTANSFNTSHYEQNLPEQKIQVLLPPFIVSQDLRKHVFPYKSCLKKIVTWCSLHKLFRKLLFTGHDVLLGEDNRCRLEKRRLRFDNGPPESPVKGRMEQ